MRKDITVVAEPRTLRGKNEARRLRVLGSIPSVVYGAGGASVAVGVSPKEITKILKSKSGHNTIFNLDIKGVENSPVMIVDWLLDPIKDNILHADLKRIDLTKRITVLVPVHTHGEPKGVKLQGGLHEVITREIEIECLPDDIPEEFVVDVTELMLGQAVRASGVVLKGSMVLLSPADAVISHVVSVKAEEVAAPVEGAEAAKGAEPEVVKKGKKEEDAPAADAKKGEKKPDDKKKK
ncbi:MAG: 50S ribosomal protein L25 [Acidobacteriota bacterium]